MALIMGDHGGNQGWCSAGRELVGCFILSSDLSDKHSEVSDHGTNQRDHDTKQRWSWHEARVVTAPNQGLDSILWVGVWS